jgi:eukaryotic-like serine/threonine-protein kinase
MGVTAAACDPDALVRMAAGSASADEVDALREHVDDCASCRAELLALVEASAPPAPGRLLAGTRLGRFVLDGVLGTGAMGTVFAARDPELGREVAIKVLSSDGAPPHRLVREAAAMAQIRHRNVVTVHELGRDAEVSFVVMERIAGPTLRRVLATSPPPVAVRLGWLAQIVAGLGAIHDAGLVHRDLKPDNIFVEDDAGGHRVVIGDLGLAAGDATAGAVDLRATRASGTPAYMAPEQGRQVTADARVDVFAFGVTAWEVLTGRRPFEPTERLPPRTEELPARVPAELGRALSQCLAIDPAQRPTVDELRRALARATGARPSSRGRRRAIALVAGGGVVAAGVVATLWIAGGASSSGPGPGVPPPDRPAEPARPTAVAAPATDAGVAAVAAVGAPDVDAPRPAPTAGHRSHASPRAAATPPDASVPRDAREAAPPPAGHLAAGTVLTDLAIDLRFRGACSLDLARSGATVTASGLQITVNAPDADHALVFRTRRVSETLDLSSRDARAPDDRIAVIAGRRWSERGDAVGGRVVIGAYRPFRALVDLTFEQVVLEAPDHTTCVVDGSIRPRR